MCCVTLSDAIASYFFWLWAGKPWDIDGFKSHFFERRLKKLIKKNHINYDKYLTLLKTKEEIMRQLSRE